VTLTETVKKGINCGGGETQVPRLVKKKGDQGNKRRPRQGAGPRCVPAHNFMEGPVGRKNEYIGGKAEKAKGKGGKEGKRKVS